MCFVCFKLNEWDELKQICRKYLFSFVVNWKQILSNTYTFHLKENGFPSYCKWGINVYSNPDVNTDLILRAVSKENLTCFPHQKNNVVFLQTSDFELEYKFEINISQGSRKEANIGHVNYVNCVFEVIKDELYYINWLKNYL